MNNDEYLRLMKQAIDESIKENDKIQQFLVWLHEKTASLGSHYQEAALRAFYCVVVEKTWGKSANREISSIIDINLDKDIHEVRAIAEQLMEFEYNGFGYRSTREKILIGQSLGKVKRLPALNIVVERDLSLFCGSYETENSIYLRRVTALLVGISSKLFQEQSKIIGFVFQKYDEEFLRELMSLTKIFSDRDEQADCPSIINLENWKKNLSSLLLQYRNLKLDWQFSDEQKQLLNKYYAANKLLVDLLQENRASPEVQKEIQDTLLLPIVEIERRKSGINKKIILDCPQEIHAIPEVKETQDTWFLPTVEIEESSSNEVQQQAQKMLPSPIDEIAQYRQENNQGRPKSSIKVDFYTKTLLYSSLLIALILYIVFITVFKHYIWIS